MPDGLSMKRMNELVQGDCVRLVDYGQTDLQYRRMLLSLGITRGIPIKVIRIAPLGCPIQIEVRGVSVTLRKNEACDLQWEPVCPM